MEATIWNILITCIIMIIFFFFMIGVFHFVLWKKKKYPLLTHRNCNVLIIGASQGIGFSIAREICKQVPKNLIIISRTASKIEKAANKLKEEFPDINIFHFACDISDYEQVKTLKAEVEKKVNSIDVMYTSHGYAKPGYLIEQDLDKYKNHMNINYFGTVHVTKEFLPMMLFKERNKQKHIIFITSGMALVNFLGYAGYCSSKWAIRSFVECMQQELLGTNVHLHIAYPGDCETPGYFEEKKERADMPDCDELVASAGLVKPESVVKMIFNKLKKGKFNLVEGFELTASLEMTRGLGVYDKCPFIIVMLQWFFSVASPFVSNGFVSTSKKYAQKRIKKWEKFYKIDNSEK